MQSARCIVAESDETATYAEVMVSPDSEEWLEAMRSELKSMNHNQVWDLVSVLKPVDLG